MKKYFEVTYAHNCTVVPVEVTVNVGHFLNNYSQTPVYFSFPSLIHMLQRSMPSPALRAVMIGPVGG